MTDIDDIKEEKMKQLKSQMQEQEQQEQQKKQLEQKKKQMLRKILTTDARSRLSNLRMAKPQFTQQVELQLIQIAKTGRIELPITDDQLQKILKKIQSSNDKSIDIKRR